MSDRGAPPHAQRDDPDSLLDARTDPAGAAFGTSGSEASSDLNWIYMLRHRVQKRAMGSSRYQWWVLWSLLAGLLALNFTFTVFNLVLSQVAIQFHTSITVLTFTMTGPLLAYGLAAPVFGKIGDIFGHRRLYLFGLGGAMISAVLTALAAGTVMLVLARTLDGVMGAATGTASGALVNMVFRPEERVKAMGWWSLIGAGGPVLGVSLGAPIIAAWGWRSLFWVQLGMLIVAFCVVAVVLPHMRGSAEVEAERKIKARNNFKTMDWIGSWSLSLSVTALMLGLSLGSILGWTSWVCMTCWVTFVVMLGVFIYRINHADNPLIPVHYFKRRNFVMPMIVRATANFAYFGGFFLLPVLMHTGYGWTIPKVGAIAIARPIAFSICSPIAGYVAVRIGERVSTIAGTSFLTLSMFVFAALQPSSGTWMVILALALSGLGMGVAMPSSSAIMANEVNPSEFGVMSAAQMLAMQVGEVAGIAVLVTIQQSLLHHRGLSVHSPPGPDVLATFHIPFIVGGCVGALAIVGALFFRALPRDRSGRYLTQSDDH